VLNQSGHQYIKKPNMGEDAPVKQDGAGGQGH